MLRLVREPNKTYQPNHNDEFKLDLVQDLELNRNSPPKQNELLTLASTSSNAPAKSLALHEKGIAVSTSYRKSESNMLDILRELDDDKTFLLFKCTSLLAYTMKFHKISEDVALNLINVMRKSKTVPELAEAVRDGTISISKARKVTPVITPQNKNAWLDLAANNSLREIEKAVAEEKPELSTQNSLKHKSRGRMELKLGVSIEWSEKLKRIQDLLSQKEKRAVGREEALLIAMNEFIERNDPLERAKRVASREQKRSPVPGRGAEGSRQRLSAETKNEVMLRDECRCTELDEQGARCSARRWLDVHHNKPVSEGGTNEVNNLRTLCSAHHRLLHRD